MRQLSRLLVHFPDSNSSKTRLGRNGEQSSIQLLQQEQVPKYLNHHLLHLKMHKSNKLESGMDLALKPGLSKRKWRRPKYWASNEKSNFEKRQILTNNMNKISRYKSYKIMFLVCKAMSHSLITKRFRSWVNTDWSVKYQWGLHEL